MGIIISEKKYFDTQKSFCDTKDMSGKTLGFIFSLVFISVVGGFYYMVQGGAMEWGQLVVAIAVFIMLVTLLFFYRDHH
ncbi:MAG: hypothetical protein A2233_03550 [Candidatus Kerfeldbacteria bacterium RIFOXYA2_FULL_38_24]|uniref:Uncharacterized protein n=1 Tax=Candidatus Kerfeldbacteria bacterium RIFOXYB2_FULL_38_14 TaxID=1798547 RepID=A0A1G2BEN7_9BACT|nr:MAG: hypothetical protein A2233_03550 [Candidatus Kerfeldbacteria bacterium RIFOXYA2_FULL_38_24]OGY87505.1 MAG: hypothetical protein A2319_04045 [Candidatus Kerfeldbacteria bacterium RIFOXYB2_FULL_38_14]OGY90240.1 MAG: hypothetical protein A2458_03740 [Candidatus Kerfeldbacteria bacterium RIFOXYC2_FULL_38_9]